MRRRQESSDVCRAGMEWWQAAAGSYWGTAHPPAAAASCFCLSAGRKGGTRCLGTGGAQCNGDSPKPGFKATRSWGRAGCQTPGMGREMLCQHPTGRARLGHGAAGCPSPPPCHTTQSSSTHRDTEGHPRYSVHISWGLAWGRVPRKPPFPITGAQFSPADSTAFPPRSLQSKVFLGAESGYPLPLWGRAQGCVPRLQGDGAQGSVGSPALVHHPLRAEQSLSPQRGWLWVNNPALPHCSRTPTSLLMKTQGLLQVGTWDQNLGSGSALNPLPAIPGETLPQATSAKHLLGQERLITPGRGLLRLRKRVLKRAVKLWVRKASGGCSVKSHLPA